MDVRWTDGTGLEHLWLQEGRAESLLIGPSYALRYVIEWCREWRVRRMLVEVLGGNRLELVGNGYGTWEGRPELEGCVDVDLSATPFTNTLPIRRLQLPVRETRDLRTVYVEAPGLAVFVDPQRYTRIGPRVYRYESLDSDFQRNLTVDGHGLVLDYPDMFRRLL